MGTIATAILAFVPVLFWGYLFSYYDSSPASARRFLLGLVFGGTAIALVLSLDSILSMAGVGWLNPFPLAADVSAGIVVFFLGYALMVMLFALLIFVFGFLFGVTWASSRDRLRSTGAFLVFGVVAAVLWQLAGITGLYGIEPASPLVLQDAVYATVGAIFFYYVLVAASEEAVKHFGFLSGSFPSSGTLQQALVSGTFVALGFSFVENILYLATIASSGSVFSGIYWQTLGYRSVFSTFLHVTCSAMLAVSFFGSFIASDRMTPWMAFRRYLIYGVGAAILVHAVFNSAMVLGFPGIVFAYLVGGYLYITSIFSSEQTERGYL